MRSATRHLSISAVRADALFASPVQRSDEPSAVQIQQAITAAVRAFGALGCAAQVAHAYGHHPEIAATRMRWFQYRTKTPSRRRRPALVTDRQSPGSVETSS